MSDEPQRNERAPIKSAAQLSPPIVRQPIFECATAVHVSGFIPHAHITVYANGAEIVGTAHPYTGQADVPLSRSLHAGDRMTATESAFGFTSVQSYKPVVVQKQPGSVGVPHVGRTVYACGRVVPVDGLTPSTEVEVYTSATQPVAINAANLIGTAANTGTSAPVETQALKNGWYVVARQVSCPGTDHMLASLPSTARKVSADPTPVPPPILDHPIPGNDVANLEGLLVGAAVRIRDESTHKDVGGGLATGPSNWAPVSPNFAAADFYDATQALCTVSKPSVPEKPTGTVPALTLHSPICPDDHSVTITGSVFNAVVVLFRSGSPLPIGVGGADFGELTLSIAPAGLPLAVGEALYAEQYIGSSLISQPSNHVTVVDCRNVVTQHNDNRRTGAYLHETMLAPAAVAGPHFGRLYERQVNGSPYAQILYVREVPKTPEGTKNLFFVATSTNDVYAFDADDRSPNPATAPVWHRNLGFARLLNNNEICRETVGSVGITSTPVIDPEARIMYVVAEHWTSDVITPPGKANMDGKHFLHALNLHDGSPAIQPVVIGGTDPRTRITFDPTVQRNRPGLLLLNGVVYVAFATFSCDAGQYHGWVFGYAAKDFAGRGIFCTSEHGDTGAGIWQSGNGLVGADEGFIYCETGNDISPRGTTHPTYGDSFLRLRVTNTPPFLEFAGQFQPANYLRLRDGDYTTDPAKADGIHYEKLPNGTEIDDKKFADGTLTYDHGGDTDLGSGGPVLLPGNRLVGGGKQGRYYVLDGSNMMLTQDQSSPDPPMVGEGFQAFQNTYRDVAGDRSENYQIYAATEVYGPNIHGGPCFWSARGLLFQMAEKDYIKAFAYDVLSGSLAETPLVGAVRPPYGMPGGHSSLSANGDTGGVVWTLFPEGDGQWTAQQGVLVAFDALTLKELWRDTGEDPGNSEWFAKFNPPTVADGKVFRPCFAQYQIPVFSSGPQMGQDNGGAPTVLKPGKIVVYGLEEARRKSRPLNPGDGHAALGQVWHRRGGSGLFSDRVGEAVTIGDARGGLRQDFTGHVVAGRTPLSVRMPLADATCHRSPRITAGVTSSVFWLPSAGAHMVTGEIRDAYLKAGGPMGKLGYPVEDETDLDGRTGRISRFEEGEIIWTADGGAIVHSR